MSKAAIAPAPSALGRFWYKWRFHLNVLLVLIPLGFMPKYFQDVALFRGDSGLGEREFGEVQVGPWSLRLAEFRNQPPQLEGPAGYMKSFNAALCQACISQVKVVYLRIGKPAAKNTPRDVSCITQHAMAGNRPTQRGLTKNPAHDKYFILGTIAAIRMNHHPPTATVSFNGFGNNVDKPFGKACPLTQ